MSEMKSDNAKLDKNSNASSANGTQFGEKKTKGKRPISFSETFATKIMPKVYGFGAAVAIMGAMFKLLSLPGGAFMLGAGLSTEAFIFFISAFEKPAKEYDWSIVFPQLDKDYAYEHGITNAKGVTNYNNLPAPFFGGQQGECRQSVSNGGDNLTSLLEKCNVDQDALNKLGAGIKNLSNLCSEMGNFTKTTIDWNSLSENFVKANESICKVAELGGSVSASLGKMENCFSKISEQDGVVAQIEHKATEFNEGLSALNSKITELNKSYDNVIRALKG